MNDFRAQRKKSVDLHFLLHRHKAGGASPLGVACAACFEALAYVFASADASLRILMTPRQKKRAILCYGVPVQIWLFIVKVSARVGDILYTHRSWRSTPGQLLKKVAQAKPKGLLHLFVLTLANFPTNFFI